jgi:protein O-mannosyl-transferase
VVANANLRDLPGLVRTWTEPRSLPQYYPLVHTAFWAEYQVWGDRPAGYHLVNVLLHALNAVLFWRLLRRLDVPGAYLAGLVFALHPVAVESVAWVTERKNVLSTAFYLASFRVLVDAAGIGRPPPADARRRWGAGFALYVMALLAKTVAASLPAALLLVAWWKRRPLAPLAVRLAPFFATGLVLGLHTAWLERTHVGASGSEWALGAADRAGIAGRAIWFYLGKLAWPADLAFIYPRWEPQAGPVAFAASAAAVAALVLLAAAIPRLGRGPLAAALFFGGTLLPALGFFDVYPMRFSFVADHFQYLACLGPIALVCAAAARLARDKGTAAVALAALVVGALGAATHARASVYRDQETLWRDTLARNPGCWLCLNNLGAVLVEGRREDEAIEALGRAVALRPGHAEARITLATALRRRGRHAEAEAQLREVVGADPHAGMAAHDLARLLAGQGRLAEATPFFRQAAALAPGDPAVQQDLGRALALQGDYAGAVVPLTAGLAATGDAESYRELGYVLERAGRPGPAAEMYRRALERDPRSAAAREGLGRAVAAAGAATGPR